MPIYTLRKTDENGEVEEVDVSCSYDQMVNLCEEHGFERVYQPIGFITQQTGATLKKAGTEWQDKLKAIKKGAGRRSTMKL